MSLKSARLDPLLFRIGVIGTNTEVVTEKKHTIEAFVEPGQKIVHGENSKGDNGFFFFFSRFAKV